MNLQSVKLAPTYSALALSLLMVPAQIPVPVPVTPVPHPNAAQVQVQPSNWSQLINKGEEAFLKNDYPTAERYLKQALQAADGDAARKITTLHILDEFYGVTDDLKAEERVLISLAASLRGVSGSDAQLASTYSKLAALKTDTYSALAEAYATKAIDAYQRAHATANADYGSVLDNLAGIEARHHHFARAEQHYKLALSVFEGLHGPHDMVIGMIYNNLGDLYMDWNRTRDAIAAYDKAIAVLQPITPTDDSMLSQIKQRRKQAIINRARRIRLKDIRDFVPIAKVL